MKERPILMSGPMVRARLEDRKTKTRRVMKPQPFYDPEAWRNYHTFGGKSGAWVWQPRKGTFWFCWDGWGSFDPRIVKDCPHGQPGDSLWVRETWRSYDLDGTLEGAKSTLRYRADREEAMIDWRPSIHMPRWASRLTLEVVSVGVERLQDISEEDAIAEGVEHNWLGPIESCPEQYKNEWRNYIDNDDGFPCYSAKDSFRSLWIAINGKRPGYAWSENPFVWVIEFKPIGGNNG